MKPASIRKPPPAWFQKAFAKASHKDDWGVPSVYEATAWRLVRAAMRRQAGSNRRIPAPRSR